MFHHSKVLTYIARSTNVLYLRMCDFFPSFNDAKPWKRHGKQYQISKFKVLFAYSCKIYHLKMHVDRVC